MITGGTKAKVDDVWQKMWEGGITNPLDVISNLTYLMFMRQLDGKELNMLRGNEMFLLIEFGFICRKNNYNCLQERGFKSTFVNILYHVFDSFQDSNSKHKVKQRLKCLVNLISTVLVLWGTLSKNAFRRFESGYRGEMMHPRIPITPKARMAIQA